MGILGCPEVSTERLGSTPPQETLPQAPSGTLTCLCHLAWSRHCSWAGAGRRKCELQRTGRGTLTGSLGPSWLNAGYKKKKY